ncbi:Fe-Mn family superoxide dismutase [Acinetobacter baumannii]
MYEHSYHMDFGAKATAYVDAFMQNLSWTAAEAALAKVEGRA